MRNYERETAGRVAFIRRVVGSAGAKGIVFGNSGGKDSALVGILCKMACEDTVGVIMPCHARRNFEEDTKDALLLAGQHGIKTLTVDISPAKDALLAQIGDQAHVEGLSSANINPRLRMTALYAIAQSRGALVAGTSNRSEAYVGYSTKWGDGAYDLNPIFDLTATEILEFLEYLKAPPSIIAKKPSAALYDGQTDEEEMGITYKDLDRYLLTNQGEGPVIDKIERMHRASEHKRRPPAHYGQ